MPLVAILFSSFQFTSLQISYELNKSYIASKLCVNRNSPEKHCNGKCYLNRQLKKASQQKEQHPDGISQQSSMVWIEEAPAAIDLFPDYLIQTLFFRHQVSISVTYLREIDHPPTA